MPGIINQLSQEQLAQMSQLYNKQASNAPAGGSIAEEAEEEDDDDDDEIPELVENFDDAAAK